MLASSSVYAANRNDIDGHIRHLESRAVSALSRQGRQNGGLGLYVMYVISVLAQAELALYRMRPEPSDKRRRFVGRGTRCRRRG